MYRVAHSKNRRYIEESYELFSHKSTYDFDAKRIAHLSTIPQHKQTMTRLEKFLTPKFYEETIFGPNVLSPFCKVNRVFYRYHFKYLYNNKVDITFWPKVKNTQLVYGNAIVDASTGRIISGEIRGEFDMIKFALTFTMGDSGIYSLFPTRCTLNSMFEFLGNIIQASNIAACGLPKVKIDSLATNPQEQLIAAVRCDSLTADERQLYTDYYYDNQTDSTTATPKKRGWAKRFFWDILGDNLLNKITSMALPIRATCASIPCLIPYTWAIVDTRAITISLTSVQPIPFLIIATCTPGLKPAIRSSSATYIILSPLNITLTDGTMDISSYASAMATGYVTDY